MHRIADPKEKLRFRYIPTRIVLYSPLFIQRSHRDNHIARWSKGHWQTLINAREYSRKVSLNSNRLSSAQLPVQHVQITPKQHTAQAYKRILQGGIIQSTNSSNTPEPDPSPAPKSLNLWRSTCRMNPKRQSRHTHAWKPIHNTRFYASVSTVSAT